jgi:hypothetical protein
MKWNFIFLNMLLIWPWTMKYHKPNSKGEKESSDSPLFPVIGRDFSL